MHHVTIKMKTVNDRNFPRDDIDSLYVSRKEGERRLASIEDCANASMQG